MGEGNKRGLGLHAGKTIIARTRVTVNQDENMYLETYQNRCVEFSMLGSMVFGVFPE